MSHVDAFTPTSRHGTDPYHLGHGAGEAHRSARGHGEGGPASKRVIVGYGHPRLRHVFEPSIMLMGAAGGIWVWDQLRARTGGARVGVSDMLSPPEGNGPGIR